METGENSENNQDEPVQGDQDNDDVIQPVIIDPMGLLYTLKPTEKS